MLEVNVLKNRCDTSLKWYTLEQKLADGFQINFKGGVGTRVLYFKWDYKLFNIFFRYVEKNIKSMVIMRHSENAVHHLAKKKRF